ncbi:MAG: alpha/beta hydrolase [Acidimicrobiales bacterium]
MPLDSDIAELLEQMAAVDGPPLEERTVAEGRRLLSQLTEWTTTQGVDVDRVDERELNTGVGVVPVRIYWPPGEAAGALPVLLWFHGGGFVLGDLDGADAPSRNLCVGAGLVVVSVAYPLAPEHPFPSGLDACLAATGWVAEHAGELGADPARLAVGGDSAGGNLAAVVAIRARDAGAPRIAFQLLVYPVTDLLGTYPSVRSNGEGYFLTAAAMDWFHRHYLSGGGDARDPLVSPIYSDDLAGLPEALVITAEFDPLRDEGEAYAERLRQAGVDAVTSRYDGMIHGFFAMTSITDVARHAQAEAVAALRRALA